MAKKKKTDSGNVAEGYALHGTSMFDAEDFEAAATAAQLSIALSLVRILAVLEKS